LAFSKKLLVSCETAPLCAPVSEGGSSQTGALIVNADDWGRDPATTDRIFECVRLGSVSSTSAMVFMEDSERAATLASERKVDVGLHLNFTTPFSAPMATGRLTDHHGRVSSFLLRNRLSQVVYNPQLASSFEYLVAAQVEEFRRIYGAEPDRIDGHHHMHLCANVLFGELMPAGAFVRRNFSFAPGEKSWVNRFYRKAIDRQLKRRHRLVDYLFSLTPVEPPDRLQRIMSLARHAVVELETHPVIPDEYRFLTTGEVFGKEGKLPSSFRFSVVR
jgi:hypothetical protein